MSRPLAIEAPAVRTSGRQIDLAQPRFGWVVAAAATLILLFSRAPDAFFEPQFWAEDGAVFFRQQHESGVSSVLTASAGYLHLGPRLTALLASPISAAYAPELYFAACVALTMWSAATIGSARLRYGWVLGALLMVPPHTGEVFATVTNAQWLMAPALAVVALTPSPTSRAARTNQLAFTILAGLSGPFSLLMSPLYAARAWTLRDRHSLWIAGTGLACGLIQGLTAYRRFVPPQGEEAARPVELALLLIDRTFGVLAHGWPTSTALEVVLTCFVAAAAAGVFMFRERRWLFAGLAAFSVALLAAVWWKSLASPSHFDHPAAGDRYFFGPRLVVIWALVCVLLEGRRLHKLVASGAILVVVLAYPQWTRSPRPLMPWKAEARKIDQGLPVRIPINPPPWEVRLGPAPRR